MNFLGEVCMEYFESVIEECGIIKEIIMIILDEYLAEVCARYFGRDIEKCGFIEEIVRMILNEFYAEVCVENFNIRYRPALYDSNLYIRQYNHVVAYLGTGFLCS